MRRRDGRRPLVGSGDREIPPLVRGQLGGQHALCRVEGRHAVGIPRPRESEGHEPRLCRWRGEVQPRSRQLERLAELHGGESIRRLDDLHLGARPAYARHLVRIVRRAFVHAHRHRGVELRPFDAAFRFAARQVGLFAARRTSGSRAGAAFPGGRRTEEGERAVLVRERPEETVETSRRDGRAGALDERRRRRQSSALQFRRRSLRVADAGRPRSPARQHFA